MSEVELTVLPTNTELVVRDGETLLSALIRSGYLIRLGCKRGGCGVCKVHVVAGEYEYERPVADTVITEEDRVAGVCLSCRAVPTTDAVIELQEGDKLRFLSPYLRDAAKRQLAAKRQQAKEAAARAEEAPDPARDAR